MTPPALSPVQVKFHLLADATTDFFGLWEGIEYAIDLLGIEEEQEREERAVRLLSELLDEGLIEFFFQDAKPLPDPRAPFLKLSFEEAQAALTDPKWRLPMLNLRTLWYSATPAGQTRLSTLSTEEARDLFPAGY